MFRRLSLKFSRFSMALDATLIALALWLSEALYPETLNASLPLVFYILLPLDWVFILLYYTLYDNRRIFYIVDELTNFSLAFFLLGVSSAGIFYLFWVAAPRAFFLSFFLLAYTLLLFKRLAYRAIFHIFKPGLGTFRQVLIVGTGEKGCHLKEQIDRYQNYGWEFAGFVDTPLPEDVHSEEVIGSLSEIEEIIAEKKIDDVVIALPASAHARTSELVTTLHKLPVKVWTIPDYFGLTLHKATVEEFAGIPMLDLRAPVLNNTQRATKRFFDLLLAIFVLPPALILMGIASIMIRLDGAGPILFRQKRVGENGHIFEMLKFRTMVEDAEEKFQSIKKVDENGESIYKMPDDPRVTRAGRVLRKTSLDELPQLFNIIKGDMSFIGPRPELPDLVNKYEPWQHTRFSVPQGLTGWWQVNGRSDKPMHLNTEDDIYYVQNYSILLDIKILIKTFFVVLRGKGAY